MTTCLIKKLHVKGVDRSIIDGFIRNIKSLCPNFQICSFNYVHRVKNAGAHFLATEGLRREEDTYLLHDVLMYVKEIVEEDQRHLVISNASKQFSSD